MVETSCVGFCHPFAKRKINHNSRSTIAPKALIRTSSGHDTRLKRGGYTNTTLYHRSPSHKNLSSAPALPTTRTTAAARRKEMELVQPTTQPRHMGDQRSCNSESDVFRDEQPQGLETTTLFEAESSAAHEPGEDEGQHLRTIDEYLEYAVQEALLSSSSSLISSSMPWKYWLLFLSLGVANSSDATEILCLSYILADDTFREHILRDASGGSLAAAVFFGMLVGGLWVGSAGDVYGRRPILLTGCFVNATAGLLAAGATHLGFLTVCRLVAGVGIGATVPPLFTLCSELAPPSQRGFWVAVVASFWMVGSLFVAIVGFVLFTSQTNFLIPTWRLFLLASALPSLMGGLLVAIQVPESPRFLALQGQHARAVQVAQTIGTKLNSNSRPWSVAESKSQFSHVPPRLATNDNESHASYWRKSLVELYYSTRILYTKQLKGTMIGLQIVWGSLSFGSYGLTTWINRLFEKVHLSNIYFNAVLFALSNLPGNLLTAYLLDSWGRQLMLTTSLLAASVSLAAFGYVAAAVDENSTQRDVLIVIAACSFQAFTIAAWNTIDVLTAEVFPTTVRSTAMGLCGATGRLAAMLAQIVNGALIAQPARLLATSALSLALGAIVPRFLIEDRTGMVILDQIERVSPSTNLSHADPSSEESSIGKPRFDRYYQRDGGNQLLL